MESYSIYFWEWVSDFSISIITLRFIHVVACIDCSFSLPMNIPEFIYLPVGDGRLGCFQFGVIVNKAPFHICIQI